MTRLLIRAEFKQGKPKDVVGLGSLEKYLRYFAVSEKACTLPFSMDLMPIFHPYGVKKAVRINNSTSEF